jgi:methyl-accepting chemotaxis protein
MFKLRSIGARLILAISLTVAVACAILGSFSIWQPGRAHPARARTEQQLKLQCDGVLTALDYALAVSSVIAALPPSRMPSRRRSGRAGGG